MKIDKELLKYVAEKNDVLPGNIYPARGGRKSPVTAFWLVVGCSANVAHCVGFNAGGEPVATITYLKSALRQRPLVRRLDLSAMVLRA